MKKILLCLLLGACGGAAPVDTVAGFDRADKPPARRVPRSERESAISVVERHLLREQPRRDQEREQPERDREPDGSGSVELPYAEAPGWLRQRVLDLDPRGRKYETTQLFECWRADGTRCYVFLGKHRSAVNGVVTYDVVIFAQDDVQVAKGTAERLWLQDQEKWSPPIWHWEEPAPETR
jgi:hypothetical protein